ncbi:MAG: pyridoxal phosphate-dependent aminotransferase [Candidatus Lokiarchaeota archaeon]|nr:pyridoxal phosphate-dependent aminotransferase [Candidatus Lokiarchaeota archaeon]
MKVRAEKLKNIKPSGIRRIFDLAQGLEGVISLGLGAPDFDTPEYIKNEMIKALKEGYTSYSPNPGYIELRNAIVQKYENEYGLNYKPDKEVCVTCGGCEGLFNVFQALIDVKDEVLIPDPGFLTYPAQVILAGGTPKTYPLRESNNFEIDPDELNESITPQTKIIVINFPNNPTGSIMNERKLKKIFEIAEDNDVLILSDEVYEKLVYDRNKHVCLATLGDQDRVIVLNSFSKTYCMTGWRLGYVLACERIINSINLVHQMNSACANSAAQVAAVGALKGDQSFTETIRNEFEERRNIISDGLNKLDGIKCVKPGGAFYVFPNISGTGMNSREFSEHLISTAKVATVPGNEFGELGENHLRLAYTIPKDKIKEALERIKEALASI